MNEVQPIRDKRKISSMKKHLAGRNKLMFVLGINLGLRISDLLTLRVSNFLDEKGKVRKYVDLIEEKTSKKRRMAISPAIKKELKAHGITEYSEAFLFASRKGDKPIGRVQAYRVLNAAAERANIEEMGTHSLRKTFGYHAYKSGVPVATIQKMFNHSSEKVTLAYIGITQDSIDEVYTTLNL